jgi:hypothetical protein
MKASLGWFRRGLAAHPWRTALTVAALIYLLLLLPLLLDLRHSDRRGAEDWVAATKAKKGAPLEPLPVLRAAMPDEIPFLRDPFEPLYTAQSASSTTPLPALDTAAAAGGQRAAAPVASQPAALASVRFIRSDLDLDQPYVIGRNSAGDLYRLRKGDRVNGGTLVDIGPSRVVIDIAGRAREIEVRAED